MNISEETKVSFFDFKSSDIYDRWISSFKAYCSKFDNKAENPSSILEFLVDLAEIYASSTLWQIYSILNKYMKVYKNINLNECVLIRDFLKMCDKKHAPKKSFVFSRENIDSYLSIDKNDESILIKCVLVIGIHGLLRVSELTQLQFVNIKRIDSIYEVYVTKSKTDQASKGFKFYISGPNIIYIDEYLNYFSSKNKTGRLFRKIVAGEGCARSIGKNTISSYPKLIASKLNLEEPNSFTGHCFRRSGATIMADLGASKILLKRAGRWKSDSVCDGYIEESKSSKLQISNLVGQNTSNQKMNDSKKETPISTSINLDNCSGFVINL